jgi:hypothetical protein
MRFRQSGNELNIYELKRIFGSTHTKPHREDWIQIVGHNNQPGNIKKPASAAKVKLKGKKPPTDAVKLKKWTADAAKLLNPNKP